MTIGTDMSNPWIAPGISMHREMELLADAGVDDITNTRGIHAVIVDGRYFTSEQLAELRGE